MSGGSRARRRRVFQRQLDGFDPFPFRLLRLGVKVVGVLIGDFREDELMRPLVHADTAISILHAILGQIERVLVAEFVTFGFANEEDLVKKEDVSLSGHAVLVRFDRDLTVALKLPVIR